MFDLETAQVNASEPTAILSTNGAINTVGHSSTPFFIVALDHSKSIADLSKADAKGDAHKEPPTAAEIQAWLVSYLAELLEINPDEVNVKIPFDRYGLDSSVAMGLTGELEAWVGRKFDSTLLYHYPIIEPLAQHLAEEFTVKRSIIRA
jgi:acyl carrier protein